MHSDLLKSCRKNLRKAKAQLQLNLATAMRGKKNGFYRYINNKRKAKENVHPLFDAVKNIAVQYAEKGEIFSAFFASIFNNKIHYAEGIQPSDRDGK